MFGVRAAVVEYAVHPRLARFTPPRILARVDLLIC
jgi:hypothetical protein